jgi:uncharacterized membrane-anchored protein YhcB (DUF1043 family)
LTDAAFTIKNIVGTIIHGVDLEVAMTKGAWIAISVGALVVGLLVGFMIWGTTAGKLPEVEKELSAVQAQLNEAKQSVAKMENNLGRISNEKLNLEKENAELREAIEKATKGRK